MVRKSKNRREDHATRMRKTSIIARDPDLFLPGCTSPRRRTLAEVVLISLCTPKVFRISF